MVDRRRQNKKSESYRGEEKGLQFEGIRMWKRKVNQKAKGLDVGREGDKYLASGSMMDSKLIRGRLWLVWLACKKKTTLIAEIERVCFPARQQFNIKRSVSACAWMTGSVKDTHTAATVLRRLCIAALLHTPPTWMPHICTVYTVCTGVLHILSFGIGELQQRSVHPVFISAYCLCELCVFFCICVLMRVCASQWLL